LRNKVLKEDLQYITNQNLDWDIFKDKTILISGASGFLPSYMVETFLFLNEIKKLNIKIIGLVRDIEGANNKFLNSKTKNLKLICHDICFPIKIEENIDYIIHAAGKATPKVFKDYPVNTILPNVIGTKILLDLAVDKKVKGFLFFSTSGVYGKLEDSQYPANEESFNGYLNPIDLSSCYLESKRMGENLCIAYMNQYGVPIKIVRPSICYGPGIKLNDGRVFATFISSILNKQDIVLTSDGNDYRNFCYVADVIYGFFTVMIRGEKGQAYNVATEEETKIIDLANLLTNKIFKELNLKVVIKKELNYLRTEFSRTQMDVNKLKALGWTTNFYLEQGFKRTIDSYKC
jgi:nucleoside-diphosphate-sugar epimerase